MCTYTRMHSWTLTVTHTYVRMCVWKHFCGKSYLSVLMFLSSEGLLTSERYIQLHLRLFTLEQRSLRHIGNVLMIMNIFTMQGCEDILHKIQLLYLSYTNRSRTNIFIVLWRLSSHLIDFASMFLNLSFDQCMLFPHSMSRGSKH